MLTNASAEAFVWHDGLAIIRSLTMQISKEILEGNDWGLIEAAFDNLAGKHLGLTEFQKPVVYLVAAQGIIENGGLRYFLESDFPDGVSHADVAACFLKINMAKAHEILSSGLKIFPG